MLDINATQFWMARRGYTSPSLAKKLGFDRHSVLKLLNGTTKPENVPGKTIAALAAALSIPVGLLLAVPDGPKFGVCAFGSWDESECIARFYAEMRVSNSVVTVNRRVASYLLPRDMFGIVWDADDPGRPTDSKASEWRDWADAFIDSHYKLRRDFKFHQMVIGSQGTYNTAADANLTLVEQAHSIFRSHTDSTTLCLLDDPMWTRFHAMISEKILNSCYIDLGAWTKIMICDDIACLVRSQSFRYLLSYDQRTVAHMRKTILETASLFANWDLKRVNSQTDSIINSIKRKRNRRA